MVRVEFEKGIVRILLKGLDDVFHPWYRHLPVSASP